MVRLPAGEQPDLVVEVKHAGADGRGMALVPTWSAVDQVIVVPAIDLKSDLESKIILELISTGVDRSEVGANAVRRLVTPRIASELRESRNHRDDTPQTMKALIDAARAWREALLKPELGLDDANVTLAFDALDWAQVMLDAELYAADSEAEQNRARTNYAMVVNAAYASAGIGPEHLAHAAQASADAMRVAAQSMQGRMRAAMVSEAEALRAHYVTQAVEALFVNMGASQSDREGVRSAGARLEGQVLASVDAGKMIEAAIRRSWAEYRKSITVHLRTVAGQNQDPRMI
jgi:hypothetical protein